MVYKSKAYEPPLFYEEHTKCERKRRYCLKNIKLIETKAAKDDNSINILFNRGAKTSVNIDNVEEKKIHEHFDFVTTKLEKLHKNLMWNMFVGRSYLDKIESTTRVQDEISLDSNENFGQFDINNPKSWNKDCISHIETTLHVNEISYDGCVCLFSVRNDSTDRDIDYDEVAWELEKVLVYHCINVHPLRLLNQESVMARQGLEPISRKVRTPGRNRAGYVVFLAYQLVESITYSQVMLDTVFYAVDIEVKKKQLLHQLGDLKMSPAVDDRIRKQIKDVREFMGKDQVDLLHQIKELKDPQKLGVILQFVQLIQAGDSQKSMAGINQFVSFLSEKEDNRKTSTKGRNLSRSNSVRSRKQSSSSFSSCSTNSELQAASGSAALVKRSMSTSCASLSSPRRPGAPSRKSSARDKHQSELADIQSDRENDESEISDAETEKAGVSVRDATSTSTETVVKRRVTSAGVSSNGRQPVRKIRPMSASDISTSEDRRVRNSVTMSRIVKDSSRTGSLNSSSSSPRPSQRKSMIK